VINGYTKSEICMLYRDAKNKNLQITILTQLTGLRSFEIENILQEGGYLDLDNAKKEKILNEYNKGLSDSAIARATGIAQSQVSKFLRGEGLAPNGIKPQKKTEIKEKKEMKEINQETQEAPEIAENKKSAQESYEELRSKIGVVAEPVGPADCNKDIIETLTPQQYYELAKLSLELLKTIWG